MTTFPNVTLRLPDWVLDLAQPGARYPSIEERMRFVIGLAATNVERNTGGPFGAAVFEADTGILVAPGVNIVEAGRCSLAHAEAMALMVAQQAVETYDLGATHLPKLELVTSSQPCIQCWGNVWWSGIQRLITGTSVAQTQKFGGFDEGPIPPNWADILRNRTPKERAVEVIEHVLAEEACVVLKRYTEKNGVVY
jgi:tRNA(Arg) A34 adenosine deaminase TadA